MQAQLAVLLQDRTPRHNRLVVHAARYGLPGGLDDAVNGRLANPELGRELRERLAGSVQLRILLQPTDIGQGLLRLEVIYSTYLATWRKQF